MINAGANVNVSSPVAESPLYAASGAGLNAIVSALLKKEADPNWQNDKGQSALFIAAQNSHAEVVATLLQYDLLIIIFIIAFLVASSPFLSPFLSLCGVIRHRNTNVNLLDKEGKSIFRLVFDLKNMEIATILAKHSNNFSTEVDSNKCTMLYLAVGKDEGKKDGGDEEGVKFLLALKVKIASNGPMQEVSLSLFFFLILFRPFF